ncbi:T9SS type A sorting domain-containing protein [Tellurirhabdus bombi]|uniref:T9SS type A sorting domain-containing protein n=1 Tax=Tellurirhabdus bombi TaxID=2907205 RepID=UPI001F16A695|nr:T9SS type A sorting domain-containing protein [Tellurirhabdus bombi]
MKNLFTSSKRTRWRRLAVLGLGLFATTTASAQCLNPSTADQPVEFQITFDKATNRVTAWYIPSVSSTHRLVTAQFSIVAPNGYTPPQSGSSRDSGFQITNINGSWSDFVFDNEMFSNRGKNSLASLDNLVVHQFGMAPQAVDVGQVTAGQPVPLFSFPAGDQAGELRIVKANEPVQKEIRQFYGSNIGNSISIQSPVSANSKAAERYCRNHEQNLISFVKPKAVDNLSLAGKLSGGKVTQTVGLAEGTTDQEILSVTPNPATSEIEVKYRILIPGQTNVTLVDLQGKQIQEIVPEKHHEIGLYKVKTTLTPNHSAGMHMLILKGENLQKATKLMIQK